jgi:hypothetical protein
VTTNTPRARMSAKRRQAIFTEHATAHNVAVLPLRRAGAPSHDRWIIEHKRALALLGPDVNTNCGPAHFRCAGTKTNTQDLPRSGRLSASRPGMKARKNRLEVFKPRPACRSIGRRGGT